MKLRILIALIAFFYRVTSMSNIKLKYLFTYLGIIILNYSRLFT